MTAEEFTNITRKGNFVAWQNESEPETTAIAYMVEDSWFHEAINCVRDSQMGEKDADGVYGRHWTDDQPFLEDHPRLATAEEISLYVHKVGWTETPGFKREIARLEKKAHVDVYAHWALEEDHSEMAYKESFDKISSFVTKMLLRLNEASNNEVIEVYKNVLNEAIDISKHLERRRLDAEEMAAFKYKSRDELKKEYEAEFGEFPNPTKDLLGRLGIDTNEQ